MRKLRVPRFRRALIGVMCISTVAALTWFVTSHFDASASGPPTLSSPIGIYTAVNDANGNPIGADLTVTASGFTPFQPVYAVVCDGKSPSDPTFSVGIDCDLGSAPAPFGASSSGTVTFGDTPGTNHNFVIHLFRGVSPQDQFNCLAPGDDPTATSVTVTNPSDASQVATIDPADPSYGQTGTSPCVIRLSTSETTKQSTDLYIPYTIPQNGTPLTDVPSAPQTVTAAVASQSATVSWQVPQSDGGSAITNYSVTASPGGESCTATPVSGSPTSGLSCTISGLTDGTPYTFAVIASNANGAGASGSSSSYVTGLPGPPTAVTATGGIASAVVGWSAPTTGGTPTSGYTVTASGSGGQACSTSYAVLTCTVTGLSNGVAYTFSVVSSNGAGQSAAATSPSVTPEGQSAPGAVSGVTAVAGNRSAIVTWNAPGDDGNSPITGYTVTASGSGQQFCTSSPPIQTCTVTGLTNGTTYTFSVTATNAIGTGPAEMSAAVTPSVPATAPDAPTSVVAVAGANEATVTWSPPASDGGQPILSYQAKSSPGAATCATTGTFSCSISGLINGVTYTFTVTASNAIGKSAASLPSTGVTPEAPYTAPSSDEGYLEASADGGVFAFGAAPYYGSEGGRTLTKPIVGMASTPDGGGYWLVASDGGVFSFGDASFYGSTGALRLNKPIVGMASTPDGGGYWLVASDGGVFSFGDASFYGSTGALRLNKPIVGMASTPDGGGYWLVASDGGVFSFGDASFYGSTGALRLNKPIVGIASTPDGGGYWLVASDGGIFNFGDASFYGSTGAERLNKPIVGIASTPDGGGYWLVASDGGIFNFGDADYRGSDAESSLSAPIVGIASPVAVPL